MLGSIAAESTADESGFTPKVGLSYFHSQEITLYGTVANGYRPGGPNLTALGQIPGCPEELAQMLAGFHPSFPIVERAPEWGQASSQQKRGADLSGQGDSE